MLFNQFASQEERRSFGGSAFMEIQFCKLPFGTKVKKIVSGSSITSWQTDSIYVCDEDVFFREYSHIFDCGTYGNLKSGIVDFFGINYFAPALTDRIIERIRKDKPIDYETLIVWLDKSKAH